MTDETVALEIFLALLKQMQSTLLGLKQLRSYVGRGIGQQMLEVLIEEADENIAEIKGKLMR